MLVLNKMNIQKYLPMLPIDLCEYIQSYLPNQCKKNYSVCITELYRKYKFGSMFNDYHKKLILYDKIYFKYRMNMMASMYEVRLKSILRQPNSSLSADIPLPYNRDLIYGLGIYIDSHDFWCECNYDMDDLFD